MKNDDLESRAGQIGDEFICIDPEVREKHFERYQNSSLPEAERQEFEDHLRFCLKCQEDLGEQSPCVDPELRDQYLAGYQQHSLSDPERQEFELHLDFCLKCQRDTGFSRQEDDEYVEWAVDRFQAAMPHQAAPSEFFFQQDAEKSLPVSAIYDYHHLDLKPYYDEKPLSDRLAAAKDTPTRLAHPVTIEYLEGQVVGQFWKRPGGLFFRLKKGDIGQKRVVYTLIYTSATDPSETRTFEFQEGEEKRLGLFEDFVASDTIQAMIEAIKRFQLVLSIDNCQLSINSP